MSALVRFCGATYELAPAPSFRIGDYPTFSAAFLDISLSAAAILITPGSALATLCRRVIQIGSSNESDVLPAASYRTSAFDADRSRRSATLASMAFRPARCCGLTQSQGSDRAGTTERLLLFDRHFCRLDYRKNCIALFEIHSLH